MHSLKPWFAALLLPLGLCSGKIIPVEVGSKTSNGFEPPRMDARVGDVIEFRFGSDEHSVVQGNPTTGCYPVDVGGFYSGAQSKPATFQVTINSTDPIFVYSSVDRECQKGMVAVINANKVEETGYRITVIKSIKNESPSHAFGGVLSKSNATADGRAEESGAGATNVLGAVTVAALAMAGLLFV
ncbi:extracellular serine-rich protein [Akanthomyces lecanii RCEF 1005]|uniref:Extracellular serine-rich protein n=1 Tax=Akanthomyces lecanii RCEF 1005 TaxID=1081108 RepID=A0A168G363_CORDF|nr:extracellular serine-rich protein [Akanthomyces lecanii RCEF 1005]